MLAEDPKVYPIKAGEEPLAFTSLFPWWEDKPEVIDIVMRVSCTRGSLILNEDHQEFCFEFWLLN